MSVPEEFQGLNLVELLDLLEPVPEPAPISMVPQTVGWLWLGLGLAVLLGWLAVVLLRRYRANAYRRAALAELREAGDDPARIAEVLRRAAIIAYSRDRVAALTGTDWLEFLDTSFSGTGFSSGPGVALSAAPYTRTRTPVPGLNDLARTWIRAHKPKEAS